MLVEKYLLSEEIDCSNKKGNEKINCNIRKLKQKIRDLKTKRLSAKDREQKEDIEYQIDSILDLIDAEEQKRDAQQDLEKAENN